MSCASETAILDKFFATLALCEDKVTYGPKSVKMALDQMAVETLLISDRLFRAKSIEQRKYYVNLHDYAHSNGINVVVFGSMSASGQRLNNLTGIAAILRFSLPQLDDMVEADEGDLDSEDEEYNQSQSSLNGHLKKEDNESDEESKEPNQNSDQSSKSCSSHDYAGFMDDVFNQLGGFEVGDYGDEEEEVKEVEPPATKKSKSHV